MTGWPAMGPAADPLPGPRLALVVATNTYTDPELTQLRAPARDAEDLTEVLADPGIGGFAVTTVIDQTAQQIRVAIEGFLNGRGTGDLLLVYLSCHGLQDDRRRLYFAATDTRKDHLQSTGVESAWIVDQLEHCRARRQVLIIDSCFSGSFAHGAKGEADLGLKGRFLGQGRGRVVLTASAATEYSFEGDPTDAAIPAGSVFTAALVQGLRTGAADTDHDGNVSVDDAYAYVFDQVQAAGAAQTPQRWLYGAEGQILLARIPAGPAIIAAALPDSLRADLRSLYPDIRIGAVTELGTWLTGGDPPHAAAARRHLQEIADTDIPRVARTARTVLDSEGSRAEEAGQLAELDPAADRDELTTQARRATRAHVLAPAHTLTGHSTSWRRLIPDRGVNSVAFSPDGRLLATGGGDQTVRLWDPATGEHRRTLKGHTAPVSVVAFSPDGQLLASGGGQGGNRVRVTDDKVRLWDPATGKHLRTLTGDGMRTSAVAFSPDGQLLTTGSGKGVLLWDPATGELRRTLTGDRRTSVEAVAFSPDGRLLAAGGDSTVWLWDPATGEHLRTLKGSVMRTSAVAFSPDGQLLAVGGGKNDYTIWVPGLDGVSSDDTVWLWDPATGEHRRTLTVPATRVRAMAFSPDGQLLTTGGGNKLWLWDPATGEHLRTLTGAGMRGSAMAFSPDGQLLATGSSGDKTVRLWNLAGPPGS